MDEYFDRLGGSDQDNFDLAALQYFEELDRQAGPFPAPRPEPAAPEQTPPLPDEEIVPDLADSGMDSVILSLMAEPAEKPAPPRQASGGRLTRPIPRKRAEQKSPAPAEKPADAPLSDLARKAAALFDSLPTEDQLLAYSLLQKLARAAEKG